MSGRDFIGLGNVVMWPVGATIAKNGRARKPKKGKRAPLKQETVGATHGMYRSRYNGALAAI